MFKTYIPWIYFYNSFSFSNVDTLLVTKDRTGGRMVLPKHYLYIYTHVNDEGNDDDNDGDAHRHHHCNHDYHNYSTINNTSLIILIMFVTSVFGITCRATLT